MNITKRIICKFKKHKWLIETNLVCNSENDLLDYFLDFALDVDTIILCKRCQKKIKTSKFLSEKFKL